MVAQYLFNLSRSAYELSLGDEAEHAMRESLAIREAVYGERHTQTASSMAHLAIVLRDRGAREESRRLFDRALRICRLLRDDESLTATVLMNYGALLIEMGRTAQAAALIDEGVSMKRVEYGDAGWRMAQATTVVADLRLAQGDRAQALALWARAVPILKGARPNLRATRHAVAHWNSAAALDATATAATPAAMAAADASP
jgi:tetratricopeptide (TPR) repeat protein